MTTARFPISEKLHRRNRRQRTPAEIWRAAWFKYVLNDRGPRGLLLDAPVVRNARLRALLSGAAH